MIAPAAVQHKLQGEAFGQLRRIVLTTDPFGQFYHLLLHLHCLQLFLDVLLVVSRGRPMEIFKSRLEQHPFAFVVVPLLVEPILVAYLFQQLIVFSK